MSTLTPNINPKSGIVLHVPTGAETPYREPRPDRPARASEATETDTTDSRHAAQQDDRAGGLPVEAGDVAEPRPPSCDPSRPLLSDPLHDLLVSRLDAVTLRVEPDTPAAPLAVTAAGPAYQAGPATHEMRVAPSPAPQPPPPPPSLATHQPLVRTSAPQAGKAPPADSRMLRRFLAQVLDPAAGPVEVRVIQGYFAGRDNEWITPHLKFGHAISGWFDNRERLIAEALRLKGISANFLANPVDRALLARANNRLAKCRDATTDDDVAALRWMYVDVDAGQKSGTSATQAQADAARSLRDRILAEHPDMARSALWGSSGNGGWILVRLPDYPNDADHRALLRSAIHSLAARYHASTECTAHVDKNTYNPSKTGCLPGTSKCKGDPTPDRPWRLATYEGACGAPLGPDPNAPGQPRVEEPRPEPFDLVAWVARNPEPAAAVRPAGAATAALAGLPRDQRLRRAIAYVEKYEPAVSGQDGSGQTFDVACALVKGFDLGLVDAWPILKAYNERCVPPWEDRELSHKLEDADAKEDDKPRGYLLAAQGAEAGATTADGSPPREFIPFDDDGNARRLVRAYGHRIRYARDVKKWMFFDGKRWVGDAEVEVRSLARTVSDMIRAEVPPAAKKDDIDEYSKWATRTASKERMGALIWVAASDPAIACAMSDFDTHDYLFNCQNGTIDLRTGELRPHDPADMLCQMAGTEYDPAAQCPRFERYLRDAHAGNQDMIRYINRYMGYSLTGSSEVHQFPIHVGGGSNGKDVLIETALRVLGDYADMGDPDLFRLTRGEKHPVGLADLRGKRFVAFAEVDEDIRLDEAFLKRATGTEWMKARGMRENFSRFRRQFKIFYAVNAEPKIKEHGNGIWRRLKKVVWPVSFVEAPEAVEPPFALLKDPDLKAQLAAESSGILALWVRSCLEWQREGLAVPEEVEAATQDYRAATDNAARFVVEQCRVGPDLECRCNPLYEHYKAWCVAYGHEAMSDRKFSGSLDRLKYSKKHKRDGDYRLGIAYVLG